MTDAIFPIHREARDPIRCQCPADTQQFPALCGFSVACVTKIFILSSVTNSRRLLTAVSLAWTLVFVSGATASTFVSKSFR